MLAAASSASGVWFVDRDSLSGTPDGLTWATAFTALQPAIDAAYAGGGGEVWVAEGSYDEVRLSPNIGGENTGTLLMREGVHLYGGFSGIETQLSERNWQLHQTIIEGARSRDGEAAYRVVLGIRNTSLDGFAVQGGRATGLYSNDRIGAGMVVSGDAVFMTNCTFRNNHASLSAGAVAVGESTPVIENCRFVDNTADEAGAIYCGNNFSRPVISGCLFAGNKAVNRGGAISTFGGALTIRDSTFANNEGGMGGGFGGAIFNAFNEATLTNCVFYGNRSAGNGGAIHSSGIPYDEGPARALVILEHCTFFGNSAGAAGAALSNATVNFIMRNSIVWGNTPRSIQSVGFDNIFQVEFSDIQGGFAGSSVIDQDPLFVDAVNGDFRLQQGSPCIDTGASAYAPATDILGVARPQGLGFDRGAYESPYSRADVDGDGTVDAADVQLVINGALGLTPTPNCDLNRDGVINATDVQLVINAALGL